MNIILDWTAFISKGCVVTLKYSVISVFFGLILAFIISLLNFSSVRFLNMFARFYVSVLRGTPLLIQLSLIYFGIPKIFDVKLSIFAAGVISFSLNSSAYVSEIIRSGINSIDKGQFEAAGSFGISYKDMMFDIILPQAIRNVLPSLVNELANVTKETAILSILGEEEITRRANMIANKHYDFFTPMVIAGICYYVIIIFFDYLSRYLEKKYKY